MLTHKTSPSPTPSHLPISSPLSHAPRHLPQHTFAATSPPCLLELCASVPAIQPPLPCVCPPIPTALHKIHCLSLPSPIPLVPFLRPSERFTIHVFTRRALTPNCAETPEEKHDEAARQRDLKNKMLDARNASANEFNLHGLIPAPLQFPRCVVWTSSSCLS